MSSSKLYRNLRRCARCGKNKEDGVTLLQCKACGVDFYCGKECQKAHWPLHKAKCNTNRESQRRLDAQPQATQEFATLPRWSRVHRPVIHYLASQELGLYADPRKGAYTLFVVYVRPRPRETNERKKFEITRAVPLPIADAGHNAPRIRQEYEAAHATNSQLNHRTYIIVIMPEDSPIPNIMPMGFELGSVPPAYFPPAALR